MNLDGVTGDARKRIEMSPVSLPTAVQDAETVALSDVDCDCPLPLDRGTHLWSCIFSGLNNRPAA